MSLYFRFFRCTSGLLLEEIQWLIKQRDEAGKAYQAFAEEIGAEGVRVWTRGGIAGFAFDTEPDQGAWKKRNKNGLYWPRKNTPPGKDLWKQIEALPAYPSVQQALQVVDLSGFAPVMIEGSKGYAPVVFGFPAKGVLFVRLPWRKVEPSEIERYLNERRAGSRWSVELEHLLWEPPADLVEVKEWQVLKEQEELEESHG